MRRDFTRDTLQLRGLVAEHDQLGARGDLGVARQRLPTDLGGERPRALGDRVRAQQRTPPPARQRARHVACSDETDHHEAPRLHRHTA